jgi:hypothetical protein
VVLVCTQLLFLNDDLVEKTITTIWQPRFLEEVDMKYHAKIRRILRYIEGECLFLTYQGHPCDRDDIEAAPLYPEGLPWPEKPADVINHIINLVKVNPKTLQTARSVTNVVNVDHHVEQLIGYALGELPRRPLTWTR